MRLAEMLARWLSPPRPDARIYADAADAWQRIERERERHREVRRKADEVIKRAQEIIRDAREDEFR